MTDPNNEQSTNDETQPFIPDARRLIQEQLHKLQQHRHANIPAEIAQKAKGAFNVFADDESTVQAQALESPVSVMVYPQDPFVNEPEIREMAPVEIRSGLMNARIRVRDSVHPIAQPDDNNNYLYWADQPQFNQVNAFYYATLTLRMYEKFAHRQIPWAFSAPRITLDPHAGTGMNAYYDEQTRTIGFFTFTNADGETFNTAQSADVVSHETGHAVLDGLRDLYNESFGLGPLAFHESFADMAAILCALHDDELVRRLLEWTNRDLRVDNFIATVAERIIDRIQASKNDEIDERTIYLRNAINKFTQLPFDELPYFPDDPRYQLGRESHNYSRLFTGAFYDVLVAVYQQQRKSAKAHIALLRARDIVGHLLVYAVESGPVGELDFSDMARAFLTADQLLHKGAYSDMIAGVFEARGILSAVDAQAHMRSLHTLPMLKLPPQVDSALEAGIFLIDKVLPLLGISDEIEFTPMSAHRNKRGFSFLTYFSVRDLTLQGERYGKFNGARVDVFGGLTLVFNPQDELCSATYRPVNDEDIRQIQILTADLIQYGVVTEANFNGSWRVLPKDMPTQTVPSVQPSLIYLPHENSAPGRRAQHAKLIRSSMILDRIPQRIEDFSEYLRYWMRRGNP